MLQLTVIGRSGATKPGGGEIVQSAQPRDIGALALVVGCSSILFVAQRDAGIARPLTPREDRLRSRTRRPRPGRHRAGTRRPAPSTRIRAPTPRTSGRLRATTACPVSRAIARTTGSPRAARIAGSGLAPDGRSANSNAVAIRVAAERTLGRRWRRRAGRLRGSSVSVGLAIVARQVVDDAVGDGAQQRRTIGNALVERRTLDADRLGDAAHRHRRQPVGLEDPRGRRRRWRRWRSGRVRDSSVIIGY